MLTPKRCAVYCRVSSDERLDQSFNSIDAQRESGLSHVISQRNEGWVTRNALPDLWHEQFPSTDTNSPDLAGATKNAWKTAVIQ